MPYTAPLANIKMENRITIILIFLIILFSCKKEVQSERILAAKSKIEKQIIYSQNEIVIDEKKHCFVKEFIQKSEKTYIVVDYVDFLTGEKAIEKAKLNGDADYNILKNGDTIYFVYSDYYISNINPKLRKIELAKEIKIELLDFSENSNENGYKNTTINEFEKQWKNHSFVTLNLENGICIGIKEQFTP